MTALDIAIEQAIARGLTATRISSTLGVDVDLVHTVWDRLDEVAADPTDEPDWPYTPPTYSAALARERGIVARRAAETLARRSLLEQVVDAPRAATCGSYAAYARHNRRREPVDPLCRLAFRMYARNARRIERARTREVAA